jgi:hypothetical protein
MITTEQLYARLMYRLYQEQVLGIEYTPVTVAEPAMRLVADTVRTFTRYLLQERARVEFPEWWEITGKGLKSTKQLRKQLSELIRSKHGNVVQS